MKRGKCTNTASNCSKAASQEIIELEVHADFECPECGQTLEPIKEPKRLIIPWKTILMVLVPLLLIIGGIWWWVNRPEPIEIDPIPPSGIDTTAFIDSENTTLLKQKIRDALENSRFEDSDSLAKLLLTETMGANRSRQSLTTFYTEIKKKADEYFVDIVVEKRDCNLVDIPYRYYNCAINLSSNDTERKAALDKRKACETFSGSNCKEGGFTVGSGGTK